MNCPYTEGGYGRQDVCAVPREGVGVVHLHVVLIPGKVWDCGCGTWGRSSVGIRKKCGGDIPGGIVGAWVPGEGVPGFDYAFMEEGLVCRYLDRV